MLNLRLERFTSSTLGTLGLLFIENKFECFTCEDPFQAVKIPGKTRIPASKYWISLKPKGSSRMDVRYTQQFGSMHEGMLELQNVPNFTGVLIHIGNTPADTEGCILIGSSVNGLGGLSVLSSAHAYENFYPKLLKAFKDHSQEIQGLVAIEIVDRDRT